MTRWLILLLCCPLYAKGMVLSPGAYEGKTFDGEGDSYAAKITAAGEYRFTNCRFLNAKHFLLDADCSETVQIAVQSCAFSNSLHGVRLRGATQGRIASCSFTDWSGNAVWVESAAATIDGNTFTAPKAGKPGPRYPIFANKPVAGLRITNNIILGPGEPFDRASETSRGTADQISVYGASDFVISGNTSGGGGENGITVTWGCQRGIVANNIVTGCDGHGIQVGSAFAEAKTPDAADILVTGNLTRDNKYSGIYVQNAHRITVVGNSASDGINAAVSDYLVIHANNAKSVRLDQGDVTLHVGRNGLSDCTVASSADPMVEVTEDGALLERLNLLGRFKSDGRRQRGIYSDKAKRGRIEACSFQGMTNGIKFDESASGWTVDLCHFENIMGVDDGFGYGVLSGVAGGHRISRCMGIGSPGRGRHFVYLSGGSSNSTVQGCTGDGWNSSTFAIYSEAHQPACTGNTFQGCTVRNQKRGQDGTGGFEISGKAEGTRIVSAVVENVQAPGVVINTLGLTGTSNALMDGLRIEGTDDAGVLLMGARGVRLLNSDIRNVSRGKPGSWSCVQLVAHYKTAPKQPTLDVAIDRTILDAAGARERITLNPTPPKPQNVTVDGKVLAP